MFLIIFVFIFSLFFYDTEMCDCDETQVQGNAKQDSSIGRKKVPISNSICELPSDKGSTCSASRESDNKAGTKWYFDIETLQCLAFGYNGCGGNANRFDSVFECRRQCQLPPDYGSGSCSGQKTPAKNDKGKLINCEEGPNSEKCPDGYKCMQRPFFGICCETKSEEMYTRNFRPKCVNGKAPLQLHDPMSNWPVIMLGKSCEDNFCPDGNSTCHQQEIFAHCCPN